MAETDATIPNRLKADLLKGVHDFINHVLKATLHTGLTPDRDAHQVWADVSGTEYGTGAGYTAGGDTVTNAAVVDQGSTAAVYWAAVSVYNIDWLTLGPLSPATPSHMVIRNTSAAGEPIVGIYELGVRETNGGRMLIYPSARYDSGLTDYRQAPFVLVTNV